MLNQQGSRQLDALGATQGLSLANVTALCCPGSFHERLQNLASRRLVAGQLEGGMQGPAASFFGAASTELLCLLDGVLRNAHLVLKGA